MGGSNGNGTKKENGKSFSFQLFKCHRSKTDFSVHSGGKTHKMICLVDKITEHDQDIYFLEGCRPRRPSVSHQAFLIIWLP